MKIVHIAPNAPYNDYWGYQENLLPKYQKKLGHDVTLITTNTMHKDGKIVETACGDYVLADGVRVIRLAKKRYLLHTLTAMCARLEVFELLKDLKPDFIFFHGLVSTTIFDVIKYKKAVNPRCVIVQDNHSDYNNCGVDRTMTIKYRLVRLFYRLINKRSIRYVDRIYGVTSWRKQYAEDYFAISPRKTDVLIMGADDEKIDFADRDTICREIRNRYHIDENDFLIVTGGKIDERKKIHVLIEACKNVPGVKLLVFGQLMEDVSAKIRKTLQSCDNVEYIGWIEADRVYDYFFAADLVCFPGGHSVLWEQACAAKVPCIFEKWDGMEHVNNGGNSDFVSSVTVDSLREKIAELHFTEKYYAMKTAANSKNTDIYLYSRIAEKSLECVMDP